jgi:hypothetical protein
MPRRTLRSPVPAADRRCQDDRRQMSETCHSNSTQPRPERRNIGQLPHERPLIRRLRCSRQSPMQSASDGRIGARHGTPAIAGRRSARHCRCRRSNGRRRDGRRPSIGRDGPGRPWRLPRIPVLLLVPRKTPPQVGRAYHLGYECLPQLSLPDVWAWGTPSAPCRLLPAKPALGQLVRPVLSRGARPTPSR